MVEMKPQKDVFWKALIYTIIIFLIGMFFGYLLEEQRVNKIEDNFEDLLLDWNDAEVLSTYYQSILGEDFCEQAVKQNIEFGDRIYRAGLKLGEYEAANRISGNLIKQKKNYALLKAKFFVNSKVIKEKCNADYEYVFYFYLDDPDIDTMEKQKVMSRVLLDLKYDMGDKIILMPFAADLGTSVVDLMINKYGITEYPSIVLREKVILSGLHTKEELMRLLK
jgi:hypothetical protein